MSTSPPTYARNRAVPGGRPQLESAVRTLEWAVARLRDNPSAYHTDDGERAQAQQARDTAQALQRVMLEQQHVVAHAIEQMAAGTYGSCEDCSRPIAAERLRILPEATRCVDCQRRRDHFSRVRSEGVA